LQRILATLEASRRIAQNEHRGQMKSILDPSFRYTKSVETDLRETFARVRRELRRQQQERLTVGAEMMKKVLPFHARKAGL
jgi:hypothetical protein